MSDIKNKITWAITIVLALMFIGAGFAKVTASEEMVQAFTLFNLPDWFRIVIGSLEIAGGILLIIPSMTGCAAFGLSIVMIGAISCHIMFTPILQGIPAISAMALLSYVFLARKNVVPIFLQKHLI